MKFHFGTYHLRMALLHRVAPRSGVLSRWLRYPNPFVAPWRRPVVDVVRAGGIGDVLMCTPALRELKRVRPACRIRFYTDYPSLVGGLPYIDDVMATGAAPPDSVYLEFESTIPPWVHLARIFGDNLGVRVRNVQPDCVIDPTLVERFRHMWRGLPRPHVIISRHASKWTPNKEWPAPYWPDLIGRLVRKGSVIEIGAPDDTATETCSPNYIDLRGQTPIDELAAAIAAADLHVGPISGPVHLAAAAGKRSVIIYGGFEHPTNTEYAGNIGLYTPVECAPCWLLAPCPYSLKCLNVITPVQVEEAVASLWSDICGGR